MHVTKPNDPWQVSLQMRVAFKIASRVLMGSEYHESGRKIGIHLKVAGSSFIMIQHWRLLYLISDLHKILQLFRHKIHASLIKFRKSSSLDDASWNIFHRNDASTRRKRPGKFTASSKIQPSIKLNGIDSFGKATSSCWKLNWLTFYTLWRRCNQAL